MVAARNVNTNRTYRAYCNMRKRCRHEYAARGITSEWSTYDEFLADMGECPEGLTLEREDNSLGYSKSNCVWADYDAQQNNTSRNVRITYGGDTLTVAQWAKRRGLNYDTLWGRLFRSNWPVERALAS